jgi:hypothetical protein
MSRPFDRRDEIRRLGGHLHALGPRPVAELLLELDEKVDVLARLEAYARLDPSIVKYLGADKPPLSWEYCHE